MKEDIDRLMQERELDALVIIKDGHTDVTAMKYMTSGAHLGAATLIKRQNAAPLLVCGAFEREEAAKSGLEVRTYDDFEYLKLLRKMRDDPIGARVTLWGRMLDAAGINGGRVGFYGLAAPGLTYQTFTRLVQERPGLEVLGETDVNVFTAAARTKSPEEIAQLIDVGRRTCMVMSEALDYLKGHAAKEGTLVTDDGMPLTIGAAKRFVRARLLAHNLEDSAGMIFAQGRDGAIPHSQGEDTDALKLGMPIVFDLFPRDRQSGYFHDMTRTWCLGHAPDPVQEAYTQIMEAFDAVYAAFKVGEKCVIYQDMVCDIFQRYGHPTIREETQTQEGYVHGLGHGIGLNIHEAPRFRHTAPNDVLEVGNAFTVEPGLYYPDRGFGVRVENSVYIDRDGVVQNITDFPTDLVIDM